MPIVTSGLRRAARITALDLLGVQPGERTLIVANPGDSFTIARAVHRALKDCGSRATLMVQPVKTPIEATEPEVLQAMEEEPDAVLMFLERKIGKDPKRSENPIVVGANSYEHVFRYLTGESKSRLVSTTGLTAEMFSRLIPIDYQLLRKEAGRLKGLLDQAEEVQITTPAGTDLTIGLVGMLGRVDDGNFKKKGIFGNLPCGEAYVSPLIGTARGRIVFDGSIPLPYSGGGLLLKNPIRAEVEGGRVIELAGGWEAERLKQELAAIVTIVSREFDALIKRGLMTSDEAGQRIANMYNLGELGIGLNRAARICGIVAEDEKVFGTAHIALGMDYDYQYRTFLHLDCVMKRPTFVFRFPGGREGQVRFEGKSIRFMV